MKFLKILVLMVVTAANFEDIFQVYIYDQQCALVAQYHGVDYIYIERSGQITLYLKDDNTLRLNLKRGDAKEVQTVAGKYFRSYTWNEGMVEHLEPVCKGAI